MQEQGKVYEKEQIVRFAHCDPAGIIFYPRFFEILNGLVEDWFANALGLSFGEMLKRYGLGTPMVDVHVKFIRPCFLDDLLNIEFVLTHLGNSSAKFTVKCYVAGQLNILSEGVLVCSKQDLSSSQLWPKDIRPKMREYLSN